MFFVPADGAEDSLSKVIKVRTGNLTCSPLSLPDDALVIQIIVVALRLVIVGTWVLLARALILIGEAEVVAESSRLLQCLSEHFVFADVIVGHGTASVFHCFLEVSASDFWDRIVFIHLE